MATPVSIYRIDLLSVFIKTRVARAGHRGRAWSATLSYGAHHALASRLVTKAAQPEGSWRILWFA